jgi:DNA-binding response OmpR family regulator
MAKIICVVEDDPLIRLDALTLLEEAGFQVAEFDTVDKALAYVDRHAPEILTIFTDVRTPGMFDGVALAQIVAISWPWVQVLVTSGSRTRIDALPQAAAFMPKPWRPSEVLARILSVSGDAAAA